MFDGFFVDRLTEFLWSTLGFIVDWSINAIYWLGDIISWPLLLAFAAGVVAHHLWPRVTFGLVTFGAGLILAGKLKRK